MKEKKEEKKVEQEKKEEKKEVNPLQAKVDELTKEVATWKDKAYRTVADCDNLRKSYEKDHQTMVKYRGQPFVEKLLPTLDSFYLVLKVVPEDQMLKNYLAGFDMIYKSMIQALESEGVKQLIPNKDVEFDPTTMQAIDVQEGTKDNLVIEVSKPGYMLRDRLVRPAMVVVSKVKEESKDDSKSNEKLEEKGE